MFVGGREMIIFPEALTEKQNKFLLFYALDGQKTALEKTGIKKETLHAWMAKPEFVNLMEKMRDSYLSLASQHLKQVSVHFAEKLSDLLLGESDISDRDRATLLIKALELIRSFTIANDTNRLLREVEASNRNESRFEGLNIEKEHID